MARSDEHNYVTNVFIGCAHELSRSELFAYGEADRARFDFACVLTRDYSRQIIGQTLTHHAAGIDKDLASLLHEPNGELPVYLYPYEARNEGRVQEFLHNARVQLPDRVSLLRLFRYPVFDADNDRERACVEAAIRHQICDDLLLNILFGRLHAADINLLLLGNERIHGLRLALLNEIAMRGFRDSRALERALYENRSTLRPRLLSLVAAGMLEQSAGDWYFRVTQRGRVILRVCHLLMRDNVIGPELAFILDRLDLGVDRTVPPPTRPEELIELAFGPSGKRKRLICEANAAVANFGSELSGEGFLLTDPRDRGTIWLGR